ncbi:MAG: class I SAM-dependent methyltransferase [Pseudomonadota bacterium]
MGRFITLALAALIAAASAQAEPDDPLRAAIDHPNRTAEERARDEYRHPYETLEFFGIEPDMTVVELFPGGGWYSGILAPYLADEGKLVAAHFNLDRVDAPSYYRPAYEGYVARFVESGDFGEIEVIPFDPPDLMRLGEPGSADAVLTFRNVHTFMSDGQLHTVAAAAYEVLEAGGVFGVVGHRLPEDREQDPGAPTGYVQESVVVAAAEKAGFTLAERSEINANPKDDADHPNGVWTLPPNLNVPEGEDAAEYRAIGESDRFTLKFVKER